MSLSWVGSIEKPPYVSDICIPCRDVQRYPSASYPVCCRFGFSNTTQGCGVNSTVWNYAGSVTSSRDSRGCCALFSVAHRILCLNRNPGYFLVWNIPVHTGSAMQESRSQLPRYAFHDGQVSRHRTTTCTGGAHQCCIRCVLVQLLGDPDFPVGKLTLLLLNVGFLAVALNWLKQKTQAVYRLVWSRRSRWRACGAHIWTFYRSVWPLVISGCSDLLSPCLSRCWDCSRRDQRIRCSRRLRWTEYFPTNPGSLSSDHSLWVGIYSQIIERPS